MGATQSQIHSLDTISKRVQFLAQSEPHKELFIFYTGKKRQSFTSERLLLLAGRFANRLRHQYGFRRNDVIANTLANSPERLITDLAITLAGCTGIHGQVIFSKTTKFISQHINEWNTLPTFDLITYYTFRWHGGDTWWWYNTSSHKEINWDLLTII